MKKQIVILVLAVVFVSCGWLQAGIPNWSDADINSDGKVDMLDLAWLTEYWLVDTTYSDEFAYIPAGTFDMGDHHDSMSSALPVHTVTLDSFYMSKYEITNQQYCDYLNSAYPALIKVVSGTVYAADDASNTYPYCDTSTASSYSQINYSGGVFSVNIKDSAIDMSYHPMVDISWYGCVAYCNWRSQQEGLGSCYNLSTWQCDFTENGFRLPTEAEWEYAARGRRTFPVLSLSMG